MGQGHSPERYELSSSERSSSLPARRGAGAAARTRPRSSSPRKRRTVEAPPERRSDPVLALEPEYTNHRDATPLETPNEDGIMSLLAVALRATQGPLARNSDSESSGGPVSQSARQEYEQSLRALREVIVKLMIPLRNTVQILKEEIAATDQRTHKEKEEQVRWNSQTWATISELMGKSQEYARQIVSLNASSAHPVISINDSATLRNDRMSA